MKMSQLHLYSLGTVVANKPLDSNTIEVSLDEHAAFVSGELTDQVYGYGTSGQTSQGQAYQDNVTQTISIPADWIPMMAGNRTSAPDVRRGERVQIWRYADTDKYYWTEHTDRKRALETATYAWNASPSDDADAPHPDTHYMLQVSSHQKLISLFTSQANGEATKYQISIDTGNGAINIVDGDGNTFLFDTVNAKIRMVNKYQTSFEVNKEDVNMVVPGQWLVQAKKARFEFSDGWDIFSTTTNHRGDFNEFGALGLQGDMNTAMGDGGGVGTPGTGKLKLAGDAELDGSLHVTKDTQVDGTFTATHITTPNNISAPNV